MQIYNKHLHIRFFFKKMTFFLKQILQSTCLNQHINNYSLILLVIIPIRLNFPQAKAMEQYLFSLD